MSRLAAIDAGPIAGEDLSALIADPDRAGLPVHVREIVAAAVIAHFGYPGIEEHLRRALEAGATLRQVVEAMMTISTPGGQRCLAFALPHLDRLVGELGEDGLAPPRDPVRARTGRKPTTSAEWPWLDEHVPEYQRSRRELSALSFVPESAALETRYREILASVILSCRPYFTVQSHVNRAVEEGATLEELVDGYFVGSLVGGAGVFAHGLPFLTRAHEAIEAGTLTAK